jgi:hypothetical protein
MVQNQGLDVYLAPFDDNASRYQQYTASAASPDFTGDPNEVYIEAVDGERFIIMVDVMESFDTKGCSHLNVEYKIDQGTMNVTHTSWPNLAAKVPEGSSLKGRKTVEDVTRKLNGDWVECGLTFSALDMGTIFGFCQRLSMWTDNQQTRICS